ncbi:MAG: hypothetical protein CV081_05275, partial [Nitrospira sp. LK265]|nr:hypothetical protein [Nitrospira sp. LK265]
ISRFTHHSPPPTVQGMNFTAKITILQKRDLLREKNSMMEGWKLIILLVLTDADFNLRTGFTARVMARESRVEIMKTPFRCCSV